MTISASEIQVGNKFKYEICNPWTDEGGVKHLQKEVSVIEITTVDKYAAEFRKVEIISVEDHSEKLYVPNLVGGAFSLVPQLFSKYVSQKLANV